MRETADADNGIPSTIASNADREELRSDVTESNVDAKQRFSDFSTMGNEPVDFSFGSKVVD